ncbi:uncharacterized protein C2orf74 homolog [Echinops telfairi]|uniref:Uncharacterized protein C2orf74 homolog n=1 Tax=Echinops telfairi TaxID=9371 RepID=A0AC55DE40_ECHTE|nr:uncharacterized protein C2orf74 homolog [Echinops telfairi]
MAFSCKCFQRKTCQDGADGECLGEASSEDTGEPGTSGGPEKSTFTHLMDAPAKPGILIQKQREEVVNPALGMYLQPKEDTQAKITENKESQDADKSAQESKSVMRFALPEEEDPKRRLKGVTFSREVIVVDLGKASPTPQSYTREHKERK